MPASAVASPLGLVLMPSTGVRLTSALLPFNATSACLLKYASTTGAYYGMDFSGRDMREIKEFVRANSEPFALAAGLFCDTSFAAVRDGKVIYRLLASPLTCVP